MSIAALLAADQTLHDAWLDGAAARSNFVFLQKLLGTSEAVFAYQRWYGHLDPLFARPFMACGHAGCNHTPSTLRTHNTCSGRGACLAETSNATIGRVAQYGPDSRALPPCAGFGCGDALGVGRRVISPKLARKTVD